MTYVVRNTEASQVMNRMKLKYAWLGLRVII